MSRSTLVLIVLGVIVITGVWWVLVVGGVDNRVADAELEAQDLQLQQATLERQLIALQDAAQSAGDYERALETIALSVPLEPEMDVFIEDMKALADRNGVDIVAIGTSEPRPHVGEPAADVLVIDLDIAIEAQFFELLGFLFAIEDFERLIVVESISVGPGGGGDATSPTFEPDVLTINMTATLYARTSPIVPADTGGGS